jgi:hypothetical protein
MADDNGANGVQAHDGGAPAEDVVVGTLVRTASGQHKCNFSGVSGPLEALQILLELTEYVRGDYVIARLQAQAEEAQRQAMMRQFIAGKGKLG